MINNFVLNKNLTIRFFLQRFSSQSIKYTNDKAFSYIYKSKLNTSFLYTNSFTSKSIFSNNNGKIKQIFDTQKKNFTILDITPEEEIRLKHSSTKPKIDLNMTNVNDNEGSRKSKRRVGRGPGSSKGKTSARGHRIRGNPYRHLIGGQTNHFRRLPKHGFKKKVLNDQFSQINIKKILYLIHKGRIDPTKPIGVKEIYYAGGVSKLVDGVKVLARGYEHLKDFPPFHLSVQSITEKALKSIKECGGSVTIVHGTRLYNRYLVKPAKFNKEIIEPYPSFKRVRRILRLKDKGANTMFKEPLWMKENDLNLRVEKLKERLEKLKNAHLLPIIPADRSEKEEQFIRPMRKIFYKKYNYESKL